MSNQKTKKVVVIGGGTGTSVVLSGLKEYVNGSDPEIKVELTAVVPVTDDGGSTGRLRDEFGFLPVGDARQCLAALSAKEDKLFRQLLLYRFSKGEGLEGHNLGNLILTALEDLLGSETQAIEAASKIFRIKGRVRPVSRDLVKLCAEYSTGKQVVSEHKIETNQLKEGERIVRMYTIPEAQLNPKVKKAIQTADLIVLGPGDLYNSIIANLVVKGASQAIRESSAQVAYIVNLMTLASQTKGMKAYDHVMDIERYLGKKLDWIVMNVEPISEEVKSYYAEHQEFPVKDNLPKNSQIIRKALLAEEVYKKPEGDELKRSLLRHDPQKLAQTILEILKTDTSQDE